MPTVQRKLWYCFYHQENDQIWQNRLFETNKEARSELDEFFGFRNAYEGVRLSGWKLTTITTVMRVTLKKKPQNTTHNGEDNN